jgi:phosphohistidine swiveling domain-containing protein
MYILGDNSLTDSDIELMGKKAGNLHHLVQTGMDIPRGVVLTYQDWKSFKSEDLVTILKEVGEFPFAVRSSSRFEDMADASFAGQYETYLDVDSEEKLLESIKLCFESATSERVLEYVKNKKTEVTEEFLREQISVFIQKQVDVKYAGVAFSTHPLSGKEEECLIETCEGLGEKLVSGLTTPSQYTFNSRTNEIVQFEMGDDSVELSHEQLKSLSDQMLNIQAYYQKPQDIEWAIDKNGKLWLLQARPITALQWRTDLGELTNADFKDGGVSARVCTHLMFSLYRESFDNAMGTYLHQIGITNSPNMKLVEYAYGIPYWNSGVIKEALKKIPGFKEEEFDLDLGIQKIYGDKGPHITGTNLKTISGAIPVLFKLNNEFANSHKMAEEYKANFATRDQKWKDTLSTMSTLGHKDFLNLFKQMITEYYDRTERDYFRYICNNTNFQTEFKSYFTKLVAKTKTNVSQLDLMSGINDVSHLAIQEDLNSMAKALKENGIESEDYNAARKVFLTKHYHHADTELDLMCPRWGETPERIDEMVAEQVKHDIATELSTSSSDYYQKKLNQILADIEKLSIVTRSSTKKKFLKQIEELRKFVRNKEQMREYSTRAYYIVRLYTLELGKRLKSLEIINDEQDIFFLDILDLLNYCESNERIDLNLEQMHYRKLLYKGYQSFNPPNEFGPNIGQVTTDLSDYDGDGLTGIACSSGVFEGTCRVITELSDTNRLNKGEILITKFTDPGWTPTLSKAAAVITEVGGVLSHAAVISREYGIPAVLNIPNATKLIEDGARIRVDGSQGIVELIQ